MKPLHITVRNLIAVVLSVLILPDFADVNLTGAGATFPSPVYGKWADSYQKETHNKINYQGMGSSAGVKQVIADTVNFGASDAPLSDDKLADKGLFQFPMVIGGVVIVVNLMGIQSNELLLDGTTLADIYLGKVKKWNDPAIVALNPEIKLPNQNIAVVRRADGSGTSFVFTQYLAEVNAEWKEKIGVGSSVNWPTGLGDKGNEGIAAFVQRLSGSIGYVEYAYAKQNNLAYTKLKSADDYPVSPSIESFSAATKTVDWNQSFAQDLTNQPGENVWPITSTTFILLKKIQKDAVNGLEILKFFDWSYKKGAEQAHALDYATLPTEVVEQIRSTWKTQIKDSKGDVLFKEDFK